MKILLLVDRLTIGGLPNYVLALARALSAEGDRVALAHGGGAVPEHLDTRGVELLALADQGLERPDAVAEALRRLHGWGPDLLHVQLCSVLPLLQRLPELGVPLIRSFHDYSSLCLRRGRRRFPGDRCARPLGWSCLAYGCGLGAPRAGGRLPGWQNLPDKLQERALYQGFAAMVVGSQHMRRVLLVNQFAPERVQLVPYFSRFDQQALAPDGVSGRAPGVPGRDRALRLLFAGQAVKGKGLEVLIAALAQVEGDWQLTAIAAGPRLAVAQALARRHGLTARIAFIEWLPQARLAEHYRAADLFVLPSVWDDPGPLVGIEALSFATPVLAFAVGGIVDYVRDGVTGLLTREVSVASLAAGVRRALALAAELEGLGEAGRILVAHQHTRAGHVARLHALYESLIARRLPLEETLTE